MTAYFVNAISLNLGPLIYMIETIGSILLKLAPALFILSYAMSAGLWIFAGPSEKMVKMARSQFVATTVSLIIVAGYFIFKAVIMSITNTGFGQ